MNEGREPIRTLPTGVPGLDAVLGGGLPEYSLNLISGGPGCGKTTLAQQIIFETASEESPALFFTVLGEPTIKLLRYQRQFSFFKPELVGTVVQYVNLSEEVLDRDLKAVLHRITREVERARPGIVVVDSFRTVDTHVRSRADSDLGLDHFVQRLALHLTSWEVTAFLLGEYAEEEQRHPVFTVADGVIWLSQVTERNSVVRKLQVVKARGIASMPGLHTFRITGGGLQIFPRIPEQQRARRSRTGERHTTGVPGLDDIMGGGIPAGDAVLLAGPAGSGKTTFATHFAAEGVQRSDGVVVAVFEEYPEAYIERTRQRTPAFEQGVEAGTLELIYLRPLDLSVDETLGEILDAVERIGASRVVIDSLSGFEIALAPGFREDFRESLYRLVGALTATGVTVFMTCETTPGEPETGFTTERVSFITDDILVQRTVEIEGDLHGVLAVVKMRGSEHAREFRTYEIGPGGAVVGGPLRDYHGILGGRSELRLPTRPRGYPGLSEVEARVLEVLLRIGPAPFRTLETHTRLQAPELQAALARIEALGFGRSEEIDGERTYTALTYPGGSDGA